MRLRSLATCLKPGHRDGLIAAHVKAAKIYLDSGFTDRAREALDAALAAIKNGETK